MIYKNTGSAKPGKGVGGVMTPSFFRAFLSRIQNFFLQVNHGGRQYFSIFHGSHFEIHFGEPAIMIYQE